MQNYEIFDLLETIYDSNFLDSIELIMIKESEYKKSNFFKKTKIPLGSLYEKYFLYKNSKYGIDEKISNFLNDVDEDRIVSFLESIISKLISSEQSKEIFNNIIEMLDTKDLEEMAKEFKNTIEKIK